MCSSAAADIVPLGMQRIPLEQARSEKWSWLVGGAQDEVGLSWVRDSLAWNLAQLTPGCSSGKHCCSFLSLW